MLSADVLEQLRLLTNLETNERKLLQIVLIGQPELRTMLERPELEQLAQRVIARFHLNALSAKETEHYIRHRLSVAGMTRAIPFDHKALQRIHELTRGVPRRINLLCDRVMLGAYAHGRHSIDIPMIEKAAREVFGRSTAARPGSRAPRQQRRHRPRRRRRRWRWRRWSGSPLYGGWRQLAAPTSLAAAGPASAPAAAASATRATRRPRRRRHRAQRREPPARARARRSDEPEPAIVAGTPAAIVATGAAPSARAAPADPAPRRRLPMRRAPSRPDRSMRSRCGLACRPSASTRRPPGASCCRCGASTATAAIPARRRRGSRCAARSSARRCRC